MGDRRGGAVLSARAIAAAMIAIVVMAANMSPSGCLAQRSQKHQSAPKPVLPPPPPPATPAPPPETRPYDAQLMRLAEILGGLTYLRDLCGANDAGQWRARMQALLDAEGSSAIRKDRLAGAFNRGLEGYSVSYRVCTPNAHVVIERFLSEGERIAKAVENRYRAS